MFDEITDLNDGLPPRIFGALRGRVSRQKLFSCRERLLNSHCYCFVPAGNGGPRRSISVGTAIDRAPFFPTARTAKK